MDDGPEDTGIAGVGPAGDVVSMSAQVFLACHMCKEIAEVAFVLTPYVQRSQSNHVLPMFSLTQLLARMIWT